MNLPNWNRVDVVEVAANVHAFAHSLFVQPLASPLAPFALAVIAARKVEVAQSVLEVTMLLQHIRVQISHLGVGNALVLRQTVTNSRTIKLVTVRCL